MLTYDERILTNKCSKIIWTCYANYQEWRKIGEDGAIAMGLQKDNTINFGQINAEDNIKFKDDYIYADSRLWNDMLDRVERQVDYMFNGNKTILVYRNHDLFFEVLNRVYTDLRYDDMMHKNVYFYLDSDHSAMYAVAKKYIPEKNIFVRDQTKDLLTDFKEQKMPKFDCIIANPPYSGKAKLHQKFFNLAVDMIKDDGVVCFLQPATPYINKKRDPSTDNQKMKENIQKYKTEVRLFNPNEYKFSADIGNVLAITTLKKSHNPFYNLCHIVCDFTGTRYEYDNLALEDLTIHGRNFELVKSIKQKVHTFINEHGSLHDRVFVENNNKNEWVCAFSKARGHVNTTGQVFFKDDFFTLVGKKVNHIFKLDDYDKDFAYYCITKQEAENVYDYCTTKFAQFCLSLSKFSMQSNMGEFATVPLVDFSRTWTDNELFDLFDFTTAERNFVNEFIGDFHDR